MIRSIKLVATILLLALICGCGTGNPPESSIENTSGIESVSSAETIESEEYEGLVESAETDEFGNPVTWITEGTRFPLHAAIKSENIYLLLRCKRWEALLCPSLFPESLRLLCKWFLPLRSL